MTSGSTLPCPELLELLEPAFRPCVHFARACRDVATWAPDRGYVPRGFVGAFGSLDEVELVLVVAEPGDAYATEHYAARSPVETIEQVTAAAFHHLDTERDTIHRNLRGILRSCWPQLPLRDQLRRTWITESYLCSAPTESGSVRRSAWTACARDYLEPQVQLLSNCVIVALGAKASERLQQTKVRFHTAGAAAPPGCNRPGVRDQWARIPGYLADRHTIQPAVEQTDSSTREGGLHEVGGKRPVEQSSAQSAEDSTIRRPARSSAGGRTIIRIAGAELEPGDVVMARWVSEGSGAGYPLEPGEEPSPKASGRIIAVIRAGSKWHDLKVSRLDGTTGKVGYLMARIYDVSRD